MTLSPGKRITWHIREKHCDRGTVNAKANIATAHDKCVYTTVLFYSISLLCTCSIHTLFVWYDFHCFLFFYIYFLCCCCCCHFFLLPLILYPFFRFIILFNSVVFKCLLFHAFAFSCIYHMHICNAIVITVLHGTCKSVLRYIFMIYKRFSKQVRENVRQL